MLLAWEQEVLDIRTGKKCAYNLYRGLKESDDNLCVHIFHLPVPAPWEKCNGLTL